MLTEKDYCDYETSVALKELEYNEKSNWWFNKVLNEEYDQMQLVHICDNPAHLNYDSWEICPKDFVIRPTMWEAQKWLREEKDIDVLIKLECKDVYSSLKHYSVYLSYIGSFIRRFQYLLDEFNSYEEALSEGIKIAVKILKEK